MSTVRGTPENVNSNKPVLSFSVERILYGNFKTERDRTDGHRTIVHTPINTKSATFQSPGNLVERYAWLRFTRYNPPKLPKSSKRHGIKKKRKPGRNPRVPFTTKQLTTLEGKFQKMKYLTNDEVALLCKALNLPENRIKIWFQNRRAREKKKTQSQDEYVDVTGLEDKMVNTTIN